MAKSNPLISDWSAGELSPWLYGRSDQPVYYRGASKLQNFIPRAQGGFYKRPGTLVIGHFDGAGSAYILVPFVISQSVAYVLEFTNNQIRVWHNGAVIATIVTTYAAADIPNLQFYPYFPDLYITGQGYLPARIRWTTPNTLTLLTLTYRTNTITFTGTSTNGSATMTDASTNLLPAEATWFLTGPGIAAGTYIKSIVATAGSSPVTYTLTFSANAGAGAGNGTFTLTLQPIPFATASDYPRCCMVAYQRLCFANTINDPQKIFRSIVGIYANATDAAAGLVSMTWSDVSTYSVGVIQLNADGTPTTNPATFLPTATFQDQVNDADADNYVINSDTDDAIEWMANANDIILGSASGEWIVPGASTANNFSAQIIANDPTAPIQPIFVTGGMIFVQKLGKKVLRFEWQGAQNPFVPPEELTFFSGHLFENLPIQEMDTQAAPERLIWFRRSDGSMAVIVWNMVYGVRAWWTFNTTGTIVSAAVIPGADVQGITDRDILYLAVQRTIGASTLIFIEQVATPYWTDQRQAIFSDCATYKFNAIKFTTVTVDTGLIGATVEIVADGAYVGTKVVGAAGLVTLPIAANYAVVGLNFVSLMTSMPLVPPSQEGTGQLKKKSIPKARFRVFNTLFMKAGQFTAANAAGTAGLENVQLGDVPVNYTVAPTTPYSGYARGSMLEALRDDGYLSVQSDLPLPCAVTAIVPDVEDSEG